RARLALPQRRLRHPLLAAVGEPRARFVQVRLIDIAADELGDAEPRAGDGRAAEAVERIHDALNARQAVEPQALFRQLRRERRRVGSIAVAPLNRLVRDEPGVPAAADTVGGLRPAGDV